MNVQTMNDYSFLSESELLALAREDNEEAFTELVRRNSRMIYRISMRILRNHEDAEDTLQNVLVKVYQRLDDFDGHSRFSTWLFRVTFNEALMTLRRSRSRRRESCLDISDEHSGGQTVSEIQDPRENNERKYINHEVVSKAMLRLQPVLRWAFLLHKREGWTHQEMADELGISVETAKSRVFRARQQLREVLVALTQ
jgi:RNA polymerase sigma-70 factor (ECF subfamily)